MLAITRQVPVYRILAAFVLSLVFALASYAAETSVFLDVVQRYADTMIESVRDTYGPQKTPLMLSAFDRLGMQPLKVRPAPPAGARRGDRPGPPWEAMVGANPQIDQNLLRTMYTLSKLTGDPKYAQAVDDELKWFLNNTQSPKTNLFPWGEHLCWNVMTDEVASGGTEFEHEFARPWMLWDRCYALAPEPSKRFALGLWEHQVADHKTGGFDRHAPFFEHGPRDGKDFARHAGFYIRTWGYAYKHTKEPVFLKAIEVMIKRFEGKRYAADGTMRATIGPLEIASAATMVPEPLASHLRKFAAEEDELLIALWHRTSERTDGTFSSKATWRAGYARGASASRAMFAIGRHEQVPRKEYRDVVITVADAYIGALPTENVDVWPMTFAHVISAEVAAYKFTKRDIYLNEARRFARLAVDLYWEDQPLPRASLKTGHYETLTGCDSLALALLEVHAAINNLKTPIPSNSIDR